MIDENAYGFGSVSNTFSNGTKGCNWVGSSRPVAIAAYPLWVESAHRLNVCFEWKADIPPMPETSAVRVALRRNRQGLVECVDCISIKAQDVKAGAAFIIGRGIEWIERNVSLRQTQRLHGVA